MQHCMHYPTHCICMHEVYCLACRDLPLSTGSFSVEMISASKRFKDTSLLSYENIYITNQVYMHMYSVHVVRPSVYISMHVL